MTALSVMVDVRLRAEELVFAINKPGQARWLLTERQRRHQEQGDGILHDPSEDDPALFLKISEAKQRAERDLAARTAQRNEKLKAAGREAKLRETPLGSCPFVWNRIKTYLSERGDFVVLSG